MPVPVAEMLDEVSKTPMESHPVPHEVPLTESEPELVVTVAADARMPGTRANNTFPFPLTPVIDTHPDTPACTLDDVRFTPALTDPPPARPSIVIFPLVVFTFTPDPLMQTPSNVPV